MQTYLNYALYHKVEIPEHFKHVHEAHEFFAQRGRFAVALADKIHNLVSSLFRLIFVEALPSILEMNDAGARVKALGNDLKDDLKGIVIALPSIFLGRHFGVWLHDKISSVTAPQLA